jgi:hypothetical protein
MKQFGKIMLIGLGFGILAVVLSTIPLAPVSGAPGPAPVIVTNTPLPVQGIVNAAQSGTWGVNAAQSGAWNVGITGNTSANPLFVRDADNPAKQPFNSQCGVNLGNGLCDFAAVPAGKELVVEMFSVLVLMNIGDRPLQANLLGTANGTGYVLNYPLSFNGTQTGVADIWVVQQPLTRAYADPDAAPPSCFVGTILGQAQSATCEISGYLVNVP